ASANGGRTLAIRRQASDADRRARCSATRRGRIGPGGGVTIGLSGRDRGGGAHARRRGAAAWRSLGAAGRRGSGRARARREYRRCAARPSGRQRRGAGRSRARWLGGRFVIALTRYQLSLLLRSYRWIPPAVLFGLGVIGLGGGATPRGAGLSEGLAWSALMVVPVEAWLTRSMLIAEPPAARGCVAAVGGPRRAQ